MDNEKSGEVLDAPETLQPEETVMEKEVVSKLETPEESTEPEKPPAAVEEPEQMAVNGHDTEIGGLEETEELIVTETVRLSEEKTETEVEAVPEAAAPAEPDESSEKLDSEPEAAEPENTQPDPEPVPENDPEPEPEQQTALAESPPEPEPEKLAETVAEAEPQMPTSPEPAAPQQPDDTQPLVPEEKVETAAEVPAAVDAETEEVAKEPEAEKDATAEPAKEEETAVEKPAEKPTEAVTLKEEAPAETENVKPVEDKDEKEAEKEDKKEAEKEDKKEAEKEDKKEAEPEKAAESEGAEAKPEVEKSEKNDAEPEKEEDPAPATGSLAFAFLEREQTKDALRTSRTLLVLRGLPGSGKSFLARVIEEAYKDHCSVVRADDHGVKPESPGSSADGYKALDEALVSALGVATAPGLLLVVDDTNHTHDRLGRLGEIAEQNQLVPLFLEPRTEWSRDVALLTKKTKRGLEAAQLETMKASLEEMSLPLYFGWFLLSSVQDKVRCTSMDFLKTLDTLEAFKKHMADFTGKPEKEVDLEQYYQAKGTLHCTTKFCDYGKAEGAKEYAQNPAVTEFYGSASELSLTALFVTPRTVGARVSLTEEQLLLWPADAEEAVESAASPLPPGSRAHVTLGCAEGVEPVQTGLDLLELLALQQSGQQGASVEEMELGTLVYYGEGRWMLSLREPICTPACFSSFYGKEEAELTKKEPEKKKKQKCTIL